MFEGEVACLLTAAIADFRQDLELLRNDAREEAICHRLAFYLEMRGRHRPFWKQLELVVDCEYNRRGIDVKMIPAPFSRGINMNRKTVVPDIVLHKRGTDEFNLLAVEVKKSSHSSSHRDDAKWKLEQYRKTLHYSTTAYLCFNVRESGEMLNECQVTPHPTFYHATFEHLLPKLLKNGLRPRSASKAKRTTEQNSPANLVYLFKSFEAAQAYGIIIQMKWDHTFAVVEVRLPFDWVAKLQPDNNWPENDEALTLDQPIPTEYLSHSNDFA